MDIDRQADLRAQFGLQRFKQYAGRAVGGIDHHHQVVIVKGGMGAIRGDEGGALAAAISSQQHPRVAMGRQGASDRFQIRVDPFVE